MLQQKFIILHPAAWDSATADNPTIKRGRILKLIPEGGVFCCHCGKQTANLKHQRLKVLSKKCEFRFPDLEPNKGLTAATPQILSVHAAGQSLNEKYNGGKRQ